MALVAAIQMTTGPDVRANLAQAGQWLEEAAGRGAVIATLPENFAFMGLRDADKQAVAEQDGEGPIQEFLASTARKLKLWIVGGTVPLRCGADGRVSAASLVFDAQGQRRARYDKIHLFDVRVSEHEAHRESSSVTPGGKPVVIDSPAGKLGLAVCYDVRFPEVFRQLSAAGAEWFCLPSAFTVPTGRAHWETLLKARAIENLCFMVAPAQSGMHASGRETYGDTMIVDYWGRILARRPRGQGVVSATFDHTRQAETRRNFPVLEHRVFAS
jgi:deaminated glutathione amidase